MENINTLSGYIDSNPKLIGELGSLANQVFLKLARHEGLRLNNKQIEVDLQISYDIKQLILNIIMSANSQYKNEESSFRLTEDEENQMVELYYYMIISSISNEIFGEIEV